MNRTRGTRNQPYRRRKARRLRGFDYSDGRAYFVTICAQDRECRFGEVVSGEMHLNQAGEMVDRWWRTLESRFPGLRRDAWQVMPNHLHGILFLPGRNTNPRPAAVQHSGSAAAPPALSDVVGWFKTMTTNAYIRGVKTDRWPEFRRRVWQRDYHDRIIRNQAEIKRIRKYIADNPLRWHLDRENPEVMRKRARSSPLGKVSG